MGWSGRSDAKLLLFAWALVAWALAAASVPALAAPAPVDEAQRAGRTEASLPQAGEDFFHAMDNGVALTPDEVKGRNMWLVWTGGDDRFWDQVTRNSLATFDLLKVVTSHPSQTYCDGERCDRDSRWRWLGALNEPCFEKPTGPDPKRFGLWLDVRGAELRARSVRGREQISGRQDRRPRDDLQGRLDACRSAPTSAPRPASSACACSRTPTSTRRRRTSGTPSAITPTRTTIRIRSSCGPTGSAWPAASAMSARARSTRRPTRPIRNGPISIRRSDRNISGWTACSSTAAIRRTFSTSSCIPIRRARWTPRSSRPTTSTTRAP